MPHFVEIPRAMTNIKEKLLDIELNLFGDARVIRESAGAYAV